MAEEDRLALWNEKIEELINDLRKYGSNRVILHKAFWKNEYRGKDGLKHQFENEEIQKNNELLSHYYKKIEDVLTGVHVIELHGDFISDENHKWGLSPFHYEEGYYKEFIKRLEEITND